MTLIVVLGGSGAATPELAASLRDAAIPDLELRLIGRSIEKLATVRHACQALAGPDIRVTDASDVAGGVAGADIVLNQVRVGGLRARLFDETFPREFGIPGEETLGAGGFANALRTVPVALELARVVEHEAPGAWFVNLTNPAGIVHQAIERVTRLRTISVCDSPLTLIEHARRFAGLAPEEAAEVDYVGMNHAGWLCGIRAWNADLMPRVVAAYEAEGHTPVDGAFVRGLGVLPNPYLRYYYHPEMMREAQEARRPRAEELLDLEQAMLAAYDASPTSRPEALGRRGAIWYGKAAVPVLKALTGGAAVEMVVGARNRGDIPWLDAEAVVELPTTVTATGLAARRTGGLPADARALLAAHAAFEGLTVDGILERDDAKLLRALTANPMIPSYAVAQAVLKRAREYSPG